MNSAVLLRYKDFAVIVLYVYLTRFGSSLSNLFIVLYYAYSVLYPQLLNLFVEHAVSHYHPCTIKLSSLTDLVTLFHQTCRRLLITILL